MKCAASEALIVSAAWMLLAYSWARRWNCRSEPVRSIRTSMPAYLALKARATFSETGRSIAAYQTTLPSFLAASISSGVTRDGAGAAARTGPASTPMAAATEALRTSRRVNAASRISFLPGWEPARPPSDAEQLCVARLDRLGVSLDAGRVVLHLLDLGERRAARLLLGERMDRAQPAGVDDELLALGREAIALEQSRRARVRRVLEHAVGPDDQRRALGRVDDLDRVALLLQLEHVVLVAVRHDRPLAERELLRRICRRLHLHHALLGELLEIAPADIAHDLKRRRHDGAAVAGMSLDDLAGPLGIEQIGEALRRLGRLHEIGVVADDAQPGAEGRELSVRVLVLGRKMPRDVLGNVRCQQAVALPHYEMGGVRRIDHVDRMDAARIFLSDALEHALGAAPLDSAGDPGIFRLEGSRDPFGHRQVDGGVPDHLPFLPRGLDQRRRHGLRRRRGGLDRLCEGREPHGARALENIPTGPILHRYSLLMPALAGQRAAPLGRQVQPHGRSLRDVVLRRCDHAKLGSIGDLHYIVSAAPQEDLAHDGGRNDILGRLGRLRHEPDIVLADRHRGFSTGGQPGAGAAQ